MLTLGKQTVLANADMLQKLIARFYHFEPREVGFAYRIDRQTAMARRNPDKEYVDDATLFSLVGNPRLDVLGATGDEGATIIHHLGDPLPDDLVGRFDLVINGSGVGNGIAAPATLANITRLLAPHGRVIHIDMTSGLTVKSAIGSAGGMFGYYLMNGFADCRTYVCTFETESELRHGPWRVCAYMPRPDGTAISLPELQSKRAVLVVVVEKQPASTAQVTPEEWNYFCGATTESFNQKLAALSESRPVFGFGRGPQPFSALKREGFLDCGVAGR